ncbi:MAG TPA: TonB-dependent receptor plug domain-containing protein, partial [Flavisolibacter sp.]|nr:TonB-dependent receptor plug domain-containing protein [Flavisolibacter sp.]
MKLLTAVFFPPGRKNTAKTLLVMKFLAIFLFAVCLQVSAKGFSQTITLSEKRITLQKLFLKINQQTGYQFFYKDQLLDKAGKIDIEVKNAPLTEVLQTCFKNLPLSYSITDKIVVIKEKSEPVFDKDEMVVPFKTIRGLVKDEKGAPLSGVSVTVRGTQSGTTTNENGEFTIDVNPSEILDFSIIGYKKASVTVGSNTDIIVKLEIEVVAGSEIVIVGYGTKAKTEVTGAVSTVKMNDVLGNRPVSTTATLLQGAAPGLQVKIGSGEPGADASFNIRGITGLGQSGAPLILVDNVPFNGPLNLIDPNDIESVTVLKDAGSAAIYGGRSAFGVLLITTKKGRKNQKREFNYNNNLTFASPQNLPEKPTPLQTVQSYKDMGTIGYWSGQNVDTWLQLLKDYQTNPSKYPGVYAIVGTQRYPLAQTDVIKDLLGNTSFQQTHNFSVDGGTDKTSYRLSAGFVNENGIIAPEAHQDSYKRYNVRSFVSTEVTSWLTTQVDASFYKSSKLTPNNNNQYGQAVNLPSYVPLQDTVTASNGQTGVNGTPKNIMKLYFPTSLVNNDIRITGRT